jgi:hypothetical protein
MNLRDACLDSMTAIIRNNKEVASKFASMDHGKYFHLIVGLIHDRSPRTRLLACLCLIALGHAAPCHFQAGTSANGRLNTEMFNLESVKKLGICQSLKGQSSIHSCIL